MPSRRCANCGELEKDHRQNGGGCSFFEPGGSYFCEDPFFLKGKCVSCGKSLRDHPTVRTK